MLITVANLILLSTLPPLILVGFGLSQKIVRSSVSLSYRRQAGRWNDGGGGGAGGRALMVVKSEGGEDIVLLDSASALFTSCIHRREAAMSTVDGAKKGSPFVRAGFRS